MESSNSSLLLPTSAPEINSISFDALSEKCYCKEGNQVALEDVLDLLMNLHSKPSKNAETRTFKKASTGYTLAIREGVLNQGDIIETSADGRTGVDTVQSIVDNYSKAIPFNEVENSFIYLVNKPVPKVFGVAISLKSGSLLR